MSQSLATSHLTSNADHRMLPHRWHATSYRISIISSLIMTGCIGVFFIGVAGWSPRVFYIELGDLIVTCILLTYIWVQMGSLILVGARTKNQMWLDALTSMLPLFVILYVVLQHHSGYVVLSSFQARTAWLTVYTVLLDVVIDLGVTVLLSRQVVEPAGEGIGSS